MKKTRKCRDIEGQIKDLIDIYEAVGRQCRSTRMPETLYIDGVIEDLQKLISHEGSNAGA